MKITLYSDDSAKSKILKEILDEQGRDYTDWKDESQIIKNLKRPILRVDGNLYDFVKAKSWLQVSY